MLKPILIGSPDCAAAPLARPANAATTAVAARVDLSLKSMSSPPVGPFAWRRVAAILGPFRAIRKPGARGAALRPIDADPSCFRGIATFDHDGLDFPGTIATERRGFFIL